jgi:CRISPR-associated protein Cas2
MFVLVTYDVSTVNAEGRRRLRRVARVCENFGQRVQLSVFECDVGEKDWVRLKHDLLEEINPHEDSVRFYFLGADIDHRVEHYGQRPSINFDDTLIV